MKLHDKYKDCLTMYGEWKPGCPLPPWHERVELFAYSRLYGRAIFGRLAKDAAISAANALSASKQAAESADMCKENVKK